MHSLVKLRLNDTAIDIVPSSVGEYCTNLISLDLSQCYNLKRIEGNFRLLKNLKELHLDDCDRLEKLADDFFDVESCLEVLSLCTRSQSQFYSFKNYLGCCFEEPVGMKFPNFPRFLRVLNLGHCDLVDGDIPYDFYELSYLQVLDLSQNLFTRFRSLSGLSSLKFLNLSGSYHLEELPDLPSSIAVLKATWCNKLESIGDLSNYKWLWKVSLWRKNKLIGCERVVHYMLQGNAVEDHFISVTLAGGPEMTFGTWAVKSTYTLQLPQNWYNDFSGFLLCAGKLHQNEVVIVIKQEENCMDSQPDHWEEFDKNPESNEHTMVGYISFGSLRHTSWWNSAYTNISFEFRGNTNPKVGLVPRKGSDSKERSAKGAIDCSEFWDEEVVEGNKNKTFMITHDSMSCIKILWCHFNRLFD